MDTAATTANALGQQYGCVETITAQQGAIRVGDVNSTAIGASEALGLTQSGITTSDSGLAATTADALRNQCRAEPPARADVSIGGDGDGTAVRFEQRLAAKRHVTAAGEGGPATATADALQHGTCGAIPRSGDGVVQAHAQGTGIGGVQR